MKTIEKPAYCNAAKRSISCKQCDDLVNECSEHLLFREKYNLQIGKQEFFVITDNGNSAVGGIILYDIDNINKTACIDCFMNNNAYDDLLKNAVLWVMYHAYYELGMYKLYVISTKQHTECSSVFNDLHFYLDGFLREHVILPNGKRSDVLFTSMLKHEFNRFFIV